jgi:hypothetical protein
MAVSADDARYEASPPGGAKPPLEITASRQFTRRPALRLLHAADQVELPTLVERQPAKAHSGGP